MSKARVCWYIASLDTDSWSDDDSDTDELPGPKLMRAYRTLTSRNFISSLQIGQSRVQGFLSNLSESKDQPLYEDLKLLESNFKKLLDADEEWNSLKLAKKVLQDFVTMENCVCFSDTAPSEYSLAVPSVWMLDNEDDWRVMAFKEISSIRREHSYLLDKEYATHNRKKGISTYDLFWCVNFLASSSEEFGLLPKRKCYKSVMKCKNILLGIRERAAAKSQPVTSTKQNQELYWRDEIYIEIRTCRQKISHQLDEALKEVTETLKKIRSSQGGDHKVGDQEIIDPLTQDAYYACRRFLAGSLQFLAYTRAEIACLPLGYGTKWLDKIKGFVNGDKSSVPAQQYKKLIKKAGQSSDQTPINWRDVAYDELKYKEARFRDYVYDVYVDNKKAWFERKGDLKELESCLKRAMRFYEMRRAVMSQLNSMNDYFDLVYRVEPYVRLCAHLTEALLRCDGNKRLTLDHDLFIPNRKKLLHLL